MIDIILQIIMIVSAFFVGYGIRAMRKPVQKRDKNGRFTKG